MKSVAGTRILRSRSLRVIGDGRVPTRVASSRDDGRWILYRYANCVLPLHAACDSKKRMASRGNVPATEGECTLASGGMCMSRGVIHWRPHFKALFAFGVGGAWQVRWGGLCGISNHNLALIRSSQQKQLPYRKYPSLDGTDTLHII